MTKKGPLGILKKFVKRPLADFNHSPQAQVAQILINILFSPIVKKSSMNSQNKITHKEYEKQMIDENKLNK